MFPHEHQSSSVEKFVKSNRAFISTANLYINNISYVIMVQ